MNKRQWFLKAIKGEKVEKAPIWLKGSFGNDESDVDPDDFRFGWKADPLYQELSEYVRPHVVNFAGWGSGGGNRYLMIPWKYITKETILDEPGRKHIRTTVKTPRGELHEIEERRINESTQWVLEPLVENIDELKMLAEVPFELDEEAIKNAKQSYRDADARAGHELVPQTGLSSPIVCISGAMHLEMFLEITYTHREWVHELTQRNMERALQITKAVFDGEDFDTVVNLGGSEQCTPPMMPAHAFDEFVVPYDGPIIQYLKDQGAAVKMHCHGKVRHALKGMIEMGVDATDPVEPPQQGDVTWAEAREIAGDDITLMGNIEFVELEQSEPQTIKERVQELLADGPNRIIMSASDHPITHITPRLAENYKVWVDTALEIQG